MLTTRPILRACTAVRRTLCVRCVKEERAPAKAPAKKAAAKEPAKPKPTKPKATRAPSAYNLFYKATYPLVKKENPEAKLVEASALIRARWAEASAEVKSPYEREAAELKAAVDAKKAAALAEKKANAKPLTAYMLFVSKNRAAVAAANPDKKMTEIAALLGKAWKELPAAEQQKYKDDAKSQLDAWKAKHGGSA